MSITYVQHRRMVRNLKRRKVGDRQYEIVRRDTDAVVALAGQGGEGSWDVMPTDGGWLPPQESLTACIEAVAGHVIKTTT